MSQEIHKGIQGVDTSTAMFIHNPKLAFEATDKINQGKPREAWMGIEMYPIRGQGIHGIREMLTPLTRENSAFPLPAGVSTEKIREWQKEFPNTYVTRIH